MRYMLLIYSQEDESSTPADKRQLATAHQTLMAEASRRAVFCAADPLASATMATTVRVQGNDVLLTDGPFMETKEQLAGYYILDCHDLDEAIEWAARMSTACQGNCGCVEVRPIREISKPQPITVNE